MTTTTTTYKRTFGVEIEFFRKRYVVDRHIVDAAREAGVAVENHSHTHVGPRLEKAWKLVYDGTANYMRELVSPPLHSFSDVRALLTAIKQHVKIDRRCGVHVHIGMDDVDDAALRRIARNWLVCERSIMRFLPSTRRSNWACRPADDYDRQRVAAGEDPFEVLRGRYHHLNLGAYSLHGTLEFRSHQASLNPRKIAAWVEFLQRFVAESIRGWDATGETEMSADKMLRRIFRFGSAKKRERRTARARMVERFARAVVNHGVSRKEMVDEIVRVTECKRTSAAGTLANAVRTIRERKTIADLKRREETYNG